MMYGIIPFDEYKRDENQSMQDFISNFDTKYNRIGKMDDMKIPVPILAFMLLKKANISKEEKMLVLTGMDFNEKSELYEQAKRSLIKFKGEQRTGAKSVTEVNQDIKLEPTYATGSDEAYWNNSRGRGFYQGRRGHGGYRGRGRGYSGTSRDENQPKGSSPRKLNPIRNGAPLLCLSCGSYRHLIANCPDKYEEDVNKNESEMKDKNKSEDEL